MEFFGIPGGISLKFLVEFLLISLWGSCEFSGEISAGNTQWNFRIFFEEVLIEFLADVLESMEKFLVE